MRTQLKKLKPGTLFQLWFSIGPDSDLWRVVGSSELEERLTGELVCKHNPLSQSPRVFWDTALVIPLTREEAEKEHKDHQGFEMKGGEQGDNL